MKRRVHGIAHKIYAVSHVEKVWPRPACKRRLTASPAGQRLRPTKAKVNGHAGTRGSHGES